MKDIDNIINFMGAVEDVTSSFYVIFNSPKKGYEHPHTHINQKNGKPKIQYEDSIEANSEAISRTNETGESYVAYKCPTCEKYHIGHGTDVGKKVMAACSFIGWSFCLIQMLRLLKKY